MSDKMKHIYRDIEGWFNFEDFYSEVATDARDDWQMVEVGCWKGRSAAFLLVELANQGVNPSFFCVDTWSGSQEHLNEDSQNYEPELQIKDWLYNTFLENMKPLEHLYTPIRKPSLEAAKTFADNSLDFVFIDASHDYDNVKADLEAWYPKMKKCKHCGSSRAILAGHDFPFDGVSKAVIEFCNTNGLTWAAGKRYVSDTSWRIYV